MLFPAQAFVRPDMDAPCKVDDLRNDYGPGLVRAAVTDRLAGPAGCVRIHDLEEIRNAVDVMIEMLRATSARLTGSQH